MESPTFGGRSWLAHLSLLSGVEVRDQYAYTSLMASRRDTIVTNFARRGYRTVALMPGMRQAWPEGAFYGFDVIYGRDLLEYEGPQFGWWSIPDQYALAKLDALERASATRAPVFVVFPTSTTHAPFGPVPPYQPAWSRVLTKDAYDEADVERAMAVRPDLTNLGPSYVRAMAYEYASLAGYLREQTDDLRADRDRRPSAACCRERQGRAVARARARDWTPPPVLHRLRENGFRPAWSRGARRSAPCTQLMPILLDAFDAPDDPADAVYFDTLNGSRAHRRSPAPAGRPAPAARRR